MIDRIDSESTVTRNHGRRAVRFVAPMALLRAAVALACTALAALALQPRLPHRTVQRTTSTRRRPLLASDDDVDAADLSSNATVFSAKKKMSEERYPYEVYDTTPPRNMVGVFALSPTTGCGDILKVVKDDGSDSAYTIKRVTSRMKFSNGRFLLDSKRADATEVNRASLERKLARLLPQGGENAEG